MADLDQVAVGKRDLLTGRRALAVDHGPILGVLVSHTPPAVASFEMRGARGGERVPYVDAQRRRARLPTRQTRAADLNLGEGHQRVARGRLREIVGGEKAEQERA